MFSQVLAVVDAKGRVAFAQSPPLLDLKRAMN